MQKQNDRQDSELAIAPAHAQGIAIVVSNLIFWSVCAVIFCKAVLAPQQNLSDRELFVRAASAPAFVVSVFFLVVTFALAVWLVRTRYLLFSSGDTVVFCLPLRSQITFAKTNIQSVVLKRSLFASRCVINLFEPASFRFLGIPVGRRKLYLPLPRGGSARACTKLNEYLENHRIRGQEQYYP